jgi:thiosulfate reductase/polysulfide reductase chain A
MGTKRYRAHERVGFPTPSGKIEFYSEQLKDWGYDPVPVFRERRKQSHSEYPLLFTSWKRAPFRHSGGRQVPSLRSLHPEPRVILHPETPKANGIADGDEVDIETSLGRIVQKALVDNGIRPDVIGIDSAWWFPEREASRQFDWDRANVNILTEDSPPWDPEMGKPNLRGLPCRIEKAAGR